MKTEETFTKYEIARILGARALQIAMNAPVLIKLSEEDLEKIKYDPIKIAEIEFESNILPISVKRPLPERKEDRLKRIREKTDEKKIQEKESEEEKDISDDGEIMEIATPEDEVEENAKEEEAGGD